MMLLQRQLDRARAKVSDLQRNLLAPPPKERTAEQWAALKRTARIQAERRDFEYLLGFFNSREPNRPVLGRCQAGISISP